MLEKVSVKREADLVMLNEGPAQGSLSRRVVRGQNFSVEWFDARDNTDVLEIASNHEMMLLTFDITATVSGSGGAAVPARSLAVLPPGSYTARFDGTGSGCVLSTSRMDGGPTPLNEASYRTPDPRVAALGPAWKRTGDAGKIQIFQIDTIKAPPDNPRLKMFQSATMSINWVDYDGPRDRTALSPHSHADFEQASLAAAGDFVHHLRVTWGKNADEWRDDVHMPAASPSIVVIPPDLIHTTQGVGEGHHLLIDIFAPPRRDFIAKKWVLNSAEYLDPKT